MKLLDIKHKLKILGYPGPYNKNKQYLNGKLREFTDNRLNENNTTCI